MLTTLDPSDAAACAESRMVPRYLGLDHEDERFRDALAAHVDCAELAGGRGSARGSHRPKPGASIARGVGAVALVGTR